jgi:hypothetical protein
MTMAAVVAVVLAMSSAAFAGSPFQASFERNCVDAKDGSDRGSQTVVVFSDVSCEDAKAKGLRAANDGDICAKADNTRRASGPAVSVSTVCP